MKKLDDPELKEKLAAWRRVFGHGPNSGAIQEHSEGRKQIINEYLEN